MPAMLNDWQRGDRRISERRISKRGDAHGIRLMVREDHHSGVSSLIDVDSCRIPNSPYEGNWAVSNSLRSSFDGQAIGLLQEILVRRNQRKGYRSKAEPIESSPRY